MFFKKVTIFGVGLIGASFGLAIRDKGLSGEIIGYGRNETNLQEATNSGILDNYVLDIKKASYDSDLLVFATPVGTFVDIARAINPKNDAIVIDLGSVKGNLVYEIESILKDRAHYVGCHPIAGSHNSGFRHAKRDLFQDALCIITPTTNTDINAINKMNELWTLLGSNTLYLDPHEHDDIYSLVSHFPHLLSYSLLKSVYKQNPDAIEFSGRGFKDMTRIAGSPAEIWKDIVLYNRDNLMQNIRALRLEVDYLEDCLKHNKADEIYEYFKSAQDIYKTYLKK